MKCCVYFFFSQSWKLSGCSTPAKAVPSHVTLPAAIPSDIFSPSFAGPLRLRRGFFHIFFSIDQATKLMHAVTHVAHTRVLCYTFNLSRGEFHYLCYNSSEGLTSSSSVVLEFVTIYSGRLLHGGSRERRDPMRVFRVNDTPTSRK